MMEALRTLLVLVLLLVSVERSECVRCFELFDRTTGQCNEELGDVDEDNCCQNPQYGYQAKDGVCQSCGPRFWSSWSPWSPCNVLCGDGVRQRSRKCFGIGQSECDDNASDSLQTEPCSGSCCNEKGWSLWATWSSCSVTCGVGGVRSRHRVCSSPPKCHLACSGPSEETETCGGNTCPVHGGWSTWLDWTACSHSCINDQGSDVIIPSRVRHRSCSNPAPSNDTVPPGESCPGDSVQKQDCSELPNCPVDGSWGAWSNVRPCSVSCGEGLQLSIRTCDSPAPKYGGRYCDGPSTRSSVCQSPCPVDGFWTGWSSWSECSSSCRPEGQAVIRSRHRSCSNPAPSAIPGSRGCPDDTTQQVETCDHLPHCPVDGGWTSWSPFTPCSVTCGVGLQVSVRSCDSPAPRHGGRPCPGERRRNTTCLTNVHCPVDGMWSEWTPWSQCRDPYSDKNINCTKRFGFQTQERRCLHQAHNGAICSGYNLLATRVCYDVHNCTLTASWDVWGRWTLCDPACGGPSTRSRTRICKPDYKGYSPTIGRHREKATFFGTPDVNCGPPPDGGDTQVEQCVNVPACT